MSELNWDVLIIGSGAGGASAAFRLVNAGKRVLMLEKGGRLPRDGSTLDVERVFKDGQFKNKRPWVDGRNRQFLPEEYYNVGGKTKWYGAALLRFSPHEFLADESHQCLGWPFGYEELAAHYDEAESLLSVTQFENEPDLQALIDKLAGDGSGWRPAPLPLGLKKEILDDPDEAKHFDGFASVAGYKSDAECNLLDTLADSPNFTLLTGKEVTGLRFKEGAPTEITGVVCGDGSDYAAAVVVLAAGAMTSPRILQDHLERTGLNTSLPSAPMVGANFKCHINSALLAFSPFRTEGLLRKTAFFLNEKFPHSTVQSLGWIDGELLATQLPAAVPRFVANAAGSRAIGFFVTTEDGSSGDNRVVSCGGHGGLPVLDYEFARIQPAYDEHHAVIGAFQSSLARARMVGVAQYVGLAGTAHAVGTLVTGTDPRQSVVDPAGKVHGFQGLYVCDGSVLPRVSRVNPALTIYAWGLRLGAHLGSM